MYASRAYNKKGDIMIVKDVMTARPGIIKTTAHLLEAAQKMRDLDVGAIPVAEDHKIIGIITDRDIVSRSIAKEKDPATITVGEVMSQNLVTCEEKNSIEEAVRKMEEKQVRRLIVKNSEGNLTGIVSLGDIATKANKTQAGEALKDVSEPSKPKR